MNSQNAIQAESAGALASNASKAVTIIVPVYNAGGNIERCLDSLLAQTSSEFEALFIDDGSTDDSLTRLRAAETEYPEVFHVLTQENRGVCETRHRGIREAQTEFVMFMDQDDYIDADYVETLLSAIRKRKADIVISGYRRADDEHTIFEVHAYDDSYTPYKINAPWARIFRRGLLLHDEVRFLDTNLGEDVYFNLIALYYAQNVYGIDYIGYNWYMNSESVSNTRQIGLKSECDPLILMNALDAFYTAHAVRGSLYDYFVYRYIVWYLLFSGRGATRERFLEEYRRLFEWLKQADYSLDLPLFSRQISSEKLFNRLAVSIFDKLHKLHLVPLFAALYCQG